MREIVKFAAVIVIVFIKASKDGVPAEGAVHMG